MEWRPFGIIIDSHLSINTYGWIRQFNVINSTSDVDLKRLQPFIYYVLWKNIHKWLFLRELNFLESVIHVHFKLFSSSTVRNPSLLYMILYNCPVAFWIYIVKASLTIIKIPRRWQLHRLIWWETWTRRVTDVTVITIVQHSWLNFWN